MPEITLLGWFHTAMGIIALVAGAYTLVTYREILMRTVSGRIYLITTLITASTALAIYQRGEFGPGHALSVLTLMALAFGMVAATTRVFGKWSRYFQALGFSATLLFHCIPAITDGLLRLPVGDPVLTSLEDPILKICYLVLLVLFLLGISLQWRWFKDQET
ncbi:MAG: hypothetical protein HKM98_06910 [Gammaproteobacteria bacterium]|nr:hypothetical protein [Gammaproteobacteria bacterium]